MSGNFYVSLWSCRVRDDIYLQKLYVIFFIIINSKLFPNGIRKYQPSLELIKQMGCRSKSRKLAVTCGSQNQTLPGRDQRRSKKGSCGQKGPSESEAVAMRKSEDGRIGWKRLCIQSCLQLACFTVITYQLSNYSQGGSQE